MKVNDLISQKMINPLIQGETRYTLDECSRCLTYISESVAALTPDEMSRNAFLGLRALLECVTMALDHESSQLEPPTGSRGVWQC